MIYVERQLMLAVGNTRAYLRAFGMETPAGSTGMRNACLGASDSIERVLKITLQFTHA